MASLDKKTSEETAADILTGDELVRIVQSGGDYRTTTGDIAALSILSLLTEAEQAAWLDSLVTAGILTPERRAEIPPSSGSP